MEWIFRTFSIVVLIVVLKIAFTRKTDRDDKCKVIKLPYNLKGVGIIMTSMSALIILLVSFVMEASMDKTIVLSIFSIFVVIFLMFIVIDYRFKDFIYDDHVVVRKLFTSTDIKYIDLSYSNDFNNLILLCDKSSKRYYINNCYKNTIFLLKKIEAFNKTNNIKNNYPFNLVRGNFYTKNIGITSISIGLLNIGVSAILVMFNENFVELLFGCIFSVLVGLLPLIFGIWLLLIYNVFYIKFKTNKVFHITSFGVTKEYELKEIEYTTTKNGIKLYHNSKFLMYLNTWVFDNVLYTYSLIKRK